MGIIRFGTPLFDPMLEELAGHAEYVVPWYSALEKKWSQYYYLNQSFKDVSFIISQSNTPLIAVSASISNIKDGDILLSNFGRPLLILETPEAIHLKSAQSDVTKEIQNILLGHVGCKTIYTDFLVNGALSSFSYYLLMNGGCATPVVHQIIDLTQEEHVLHKNIRKSYTSLINWGEKNLVISIAENESIQLKDIEAARELHAYVSGRITRDEKTWDTQYAMAKMNQGFLISGYMNSELVSFAFFNKSKTNCYYGCSASKRELFDKPISHALLWRGILHAKQKGCTSFEIGPLKFPSNQTAKKEVDISIFKKGFGGLSKLQLDIVWDYSSVIK